MGEKLHSREEQIERLMLSKVRVGDVLTVTTGIYDHAWTYSFTVEQASQWPKGTLKATAPDGSEAVVADFEVHGVGRWTSRRENPVQRQDRAISSYFDSVHLDAFLIGRFEGHNDRAIFDKPGQEITQISITRLD